MKFMYWIIFLPYMFVVLKSCVGSAEKPKFTEPVSNVTEITGRNIKISCVVDNLGRYQVTWSHLDSKTLLTLDNKVITRNERFDISNNQRRTWWLHINNVQSSDKGSYMCQVNTSPMISQIGHLNVLVPPQIDESKTSADVSVQENEKVVLRCEADGYPKPTVSWQREDNKFLQLGKKKVKTLDSNKLVINKVSRLHMGSYLCMASNNVQPSISKLIQLNVNFSPTIRVPNQLVGAAIGSEVTLECNLEAFPLAMTYWTRQDTDDDEQIIMPSKKYSVLQHKDDVNEYKTQMRLTIHKLNGKDYGSYKCEAKSQEGETNGQIRLYETKSPKHFTSASSSDSNKISKGNENSSALVLPSRRNYNDNHRSDGDLVSIENEESSYTVACATTSRTYATIVTASSMLLLLIN